MKKIFLVLTLILTTFFFSMGQGKLTNKPTDGTLDATDLFWSVHGGTTDKKMYGITLMDYSNASVDSVRDELGDSIAQVRSEIVGEGAFSKIGNYIYPTVNNDSLVLGGSVPLAKLDVQNGDALFENAYADSVYADVVRIQGNAMYGGLYIEDGKLDMGLQNRISWLNLSTIWEVGTQLYFYSPTSGILSLADLSSSYLFSNGLTSSGNTVKWKGALTENTSITGGVYTLGLSALTLTLSGTNSVSITSPATTITSPATTITSPATTITSTDNYTLYMDSAFTFRMTYDSLYFYSLPAYSAAPGFLDLRTSPIGIVYHGDYSATVKDNDRSIPDVGTVKRIIYDTLHFSATTGLKQSAGNFQFYVGTTTLQIIPSIGGYSGFGTNNFGGLQFGNYNSDVMASFHNDTLRNDADSAITWSKRAIREYVEANGGGEVHISGTPSAGQIPILTDANTIEGKDSLKWGNRKLSVTGKIQASDTVQAQILRLTNNSIGVISFINDLEIRSGGTKAWNMDLGGLTGQSTNCPALLNQISYSNVPNILPNEGNPNTGIGWPGADKLSLTAGGNDALRVCKDSVSIKQDMIFQTGKKLYLTHTKSIWLDASNGVYLTVNADDRFQVNTNGVQRFYIRDDTTKVENNLVCEDSVYLDYIAPGGMPSTGTFATISPTKALDTATISTSGEPITYKEYLPDFKTYYNDTKKVGKYDERQWITGFDTNKMQFTWTRTLPPTMKAFEILQRGIEQRDEYLKELYEQNESQQIRIEKLEKENADYKTRIEVIEKKLGL